MTTLTEPRTAAQIIAQSEALKKLVELKDTL